MCDRPTSATSSTMATFRITMRLFTRADSLIPMTSTADISATIKTAGRLTIAPVRLSPGCAHPTAWAATCAVVHSWVGGAVRLAGIRTPNRPSSDTKWPDQPTPTVAAPAAYSSTRSQPMIQAASSPMVAYEYVYALPATGTALAISAWHRPANPQAMPTRIIESGTAGP